MPTSLGPAEILVILVVALIVLGPKRLPEAGRQVGKAIAEVRRWSQGFQDEVRSAVDLDSGRPSYSTPPPFTPPPPSPPPPPTSTAAPPTSTAPATSAPPPSSTAPAGDPAPTDPPGPPAGEPPRT